MRLKDIPRAKPKPPGELTYLLNFGAGVQSSTLAAMFATGAIDRERFPYPEAAMFADVGDEPKEVYEWLEFMRPRIGIPLWEVTQARPLSEETLRLRRRRDGDRYSRCGIPAFTLEPDGERGHMPRYCTHDYKIAPLTALARRLSGTRKAETEPRVVQYIGISTDEEIRCKPSRLPWSLHRWPLIEMGMSRRDCVEWMLSAGWPRPPKSACKQCPYHDNAHWARMKRDAPDEFRFAVEFERAFQKVKAASKGMRGVPYLHASRRPLDEIDFGTVAEDSTPLGFVNECEGLCGL